MQQETIPVAQAVAVPAQIHMGQQQVGLWPFLFDMCPDMA